jgi:hypothetical protein
MEFPFKKAVLPLGLGLLLIGCFGHLNFGLIAYTASAFCGVAVLRGCDAAEIRLATTYGFFIGILASLIL